MAYDWSKNAEEGAPAEKIPAGVHDLEIVKVLRGPKSGSPFESKGGDPQLMVVFADAGGSEAAIMVTLSDKAGWVLARLLSRCGVDLDQMKADGIEPKAFANQKYAHSVLVGLKCRAEVTWETGDNGKEYPDVVPVKVEGEQPKKVLQPAGKAGGYEPGKPMSEDDIPF